MKYWAVCYGNYCRWQRAADEEKAARLAFGIYLKERMTIVQFPSNPKYMANKVKYPFLETVYQRHERKTGYKIWR